MRAGTVIGTVVCTIMHPAFHGDKLLLTLPWNTKTWNAGGEADFDNSLVVFDNIGAGIGQKIAFSESGEAAAALNPPKPIDAFCAMLLDEIEYDPEAGKRE